MNYLNKAKEVDNQMKAQGFQTAQPLQSIAQFTIQTVGGDDDVVKKPVEE